MNALKAVPRQVWLQAQFFVFGGGLAILSTSVWNSYNPKAIELPVIYSDSQVRIYKLRSLGGGEFPLPEFKGPFWILPCQSSTTVSGADLSLCENVKSVNEYDKLSNGVPLFPSKSSLSVTTKMGFHGVVVESRPREASWKEHDLFERDDRNRLKRIDVFSAPNSEPPGMAPIGSQILYEDKSVRIWDLYIQPGSSNTFRHFISNPHFHIALGYEGSLLETTGKEIQNLVEINDSISFKSRNGFVVDKGRLQTMNNCGKMPYRAILVEPLSMIKSIL